MREEYLVDEPCTMARYIDGKISYLYDLCILRRRGGNIDEKEELVRELLKTYKSEIAIDNVLRDLYTGTYTLNQLLERKGFLQ